MKGIVLAGGSGTRSVSYTHLDVYKRQGEGYAFPRELAGDSVSFYSKAGCQEPMLLNSDGIFFAEDVYKRQRNTVPRRSLRPP